MLQPHLFSILSYFYSAQLQTNVILAAIQFWEDNLCVTFVSDPTASSTNGLQFTKAGGCWSNVGVQGGWQLVSIDNGCEWVLLN